MLGDRIPHSTLPPAEIGTAQQEIPVDKVYVVICACNRNSYDPLEVDTWIQSVHRTEKGAQDCVRKCHAEQLREQLEAVLKSPGCYSPELPLSWTYKATEVED